MSRHKLDHPPIKQRPPFVHAHDREVVPNNNPTPLISSHISPGQVLHLQRWAGNQATQHYIAQLQRQPQTQTPTATVEFQHFLNSGTGVTNKQLGDIFAAGYMMNAVELQFMVNAAARRQYRNLTPRQWSGPEVVWVKSGDPLSGSSTWRAISQGPGTGADDPQPANVTQQGDTLAYYDSPGINLIGHIQTRPSRIHVVQNFTGWIEGSPVGGGSPTRLCPVAAWYSIVSLVNSNWSDRSAVPHYERLSYNQSGTGWRDTTTPPEY